MHVDVNKEHVDALAKFKRSPVNRYRLPHQIIVLMVVQSADALQVAKVSCQRGTQLNYTRAGNGIYMQRKRIENIYRILQKSWVIDWRCRGAMMGTQSVVGGLLSGGRVGAVDALCINPRVKSMIGRERIYNCGGRGFQAWSRMMSVSSDVEWVEQAESKGEDERAPPQYSNQAHVSVEGKIMKVQYRSNESGYSVLKVGIDPERATDVPNLALEGSGSKFRYGQKKRRRDLSITVVGILPVLHVGQGVTVHGSWTTHPTYGMQLKAQQVETRTPSGHEDLVSFLSGGAIHGVGPSTAVRMVEVWGTDILDVLDSPDAIVKLQQCDGIGKNKAVAIKSAWDCGRDARDGAKFLCEGGIPAGPAQRVAELFGGDTQSKVVADPYSTLSRFGISLDAIEAFAVKTGVMSDFVSRISLVITRCLMASSNRDGHAYLPWGELEGLAMTRLETLSHRFGGAFRTVTPDQLKLVAWHMCHKGTLICETGDSFHGSDSNVGNISIPSISADEMRGILYGVTKRQMESLLDTHGENLVGILSGDEEEAVDLLKKCPGIGPKTVEKILTAWKENRPDTQGRALLHGVSIIEDLEMANIDSPCEWTDSVRCYLPQFHKAETTIVDCVTGKSSISQDVSLSRAQKIKQWIDMNQETTNVVLSKGQRAAIELASDAPILVITGGPGCGKTTVLQYIVKLWCAQGKMVHICAPTGRAAQRIGAIQNVEPSTIHRLLKYRPKSSSEAQSGMSLESLDEDEIDWGEMDCFEHGLTNKLESDAVLVDEASMLSLPLAAALMQSLKPETQLILVGDVDQLPPVGPGGILDAVISSGVVPVVDLREIFRQETTSNIVTSALSVRSGKYPPVPELQLDGENAFDQIVHQKGSFVVRTGDNIIESVERIVKTMVQEPGADIGDTQIISPMRKGPVGVGVLNPRIQAIVNPPELGKLEVSRGDVILRMGDRVLQLHNDYDKDVYNGDQGTIVDVDPVLKKVWVQFSKGFGGDCQLLEYSGMELSHLDLAYAVTVHKAQGGEAKNVVMALSHHHGRLLTRPLLYTGITRARETLAMVVGSTVIDPVSVAINTVGMETRLSSLVERLVSKATTLHIPHCEVASFFDEQEEYANTNGLQEVLNELQVQKNTADKIIKIFESQNLSCVDAEMLQANIQLVSDSCTSGQASPDQVLESVPFLMVASQDYLSKSLEFSTKIHGGMMFSSPGHDDNNSSLVMQLAYLRHAWQANH